MSDLNLEKFDPTAAELTAMVEKTRGLTLAIKDKATIELIHESRIELKKARVRIEKAGKALREDATAFAKAVIAKEKELIAIVEPEEQRLKAMEDEIEKEAELKRRREMLPVRYEKLKEADPEGAEFPEEAVIGLDDAQFTELVNNTTAARLQREREALEAERRKIEEEKAEAERKKREEEEAKEKEQREAAERERDRREKFLFSLGFKWNGRTYVFHDKYVVPLDTVRQLTDAEWDTECKEIIENTKCIQEEIDRAREQEIEEAKKKAAKDEREKQERLQREKEEKAERERIAEERRKAKEQAELEEKKRYQNFLAKIGYTEETKDQFVVNGTPTFVTFYKKVGEYKV